ncbi:hypothetical protein [Changchengzhania lutea]|nr:hypothetical protein [Changchengzhania lutea]
MQLKSLQSQLSGELLHDDLIKAIYATDASVYRKLPLAIPTVILNFQLLF